MTTLVTPSPVAATKKLEAKIKARNAAYEVAKDDGAVGNGSTIDDAGIATAIAARPLPVEYSATAYNNPRGSDVTPDGLVHNRTSGRLYNPTLARTAPMFGREVLAVWFNEFHNKNNSNTSTAQAPTREAVCSGDSTTYGVGATTPQFTYPNALAFEAKIRGYANVVVTNNGQSGKAVQDWVQATARNGFGSGGYLQNVDLPRIASGAKLLILKWGANDPFFGRATDQIIADYRTGLALIRATYGLTQLGIVLVSPGPMNDVFYGRTEFYFDVLSKALRQMALDFDCAFVDSFGLMSNAHSAAGIYMDSDSTSGTPRAIHPTDAFYAAQASVVADLVVPWGYAEGRVNGVWNHSATLAADNRLPTDAPDYYFCGVDQRRVTGAGTNALTGPFDGVSWTFKSPEGASLQINMPLLNATAGVGLVMRTGWANVWDTWLGQLKDASGILANSWTAYTTGGFAGPVYSIGLDGYVKMSGHVAPGTVTVGTTILTLPARARPAATYTFLVPSSGGSAQLSIDTSGNLKIVSILASQTYLSLSGIDFKAVA